jgi:hypothetical protein
MIPKVTNEKMAPKKDPINLTTPETSAYARALYRDFPAKVKTR